MATTFPAPDLHLAADHARRFLVRRHLLDPPRALPAKADSVLRAVARLGSLQFDPLEVPGARNHDLVLHSRIKGYQRAWCEGWLYGPRGSRRLIELYNKALNILPIEELPYYRLAWARAAANYREFIEGHRDLADRIRAHIRDEGPVSTSAFRDVDHRIQWWWDTPTTTTTAARALLETLFIVGELGIARREGNRRYYDLIERLVPEALLETHAPEPEQMRHRILSRHHAVGLLATTGNAELVWGGGAGPVAERAKITAGLIDDGTLVPVGVESLRGTRLVLAEELPIVTSAATRKASGKVTFVAPLDPLMWDRPMVRDLFGFDYLWEVYTPAAKRRHGYYVLPILFGDRFVGRFEPRYDRRARRLAIAGIWFEDGFRPMEEPHFLVALGGALGAYQSFVGADAVSWPRTRLGREMARALAAVSP